MSNFKQLGARLKELVQSRPNADELKLKVNEALELINELDAELTKPVEMQNEVDASNVLIGELVVKTRRSLQQVLAKACNEAAVIKTTHKILIEISITKPLNDVDPITLDDIDYDNFIKEARARLVIQGIHDGYVGSSTGNVYKLRTLISWHNQRPQSKDEQKDIPGLKKLIDPISNEPFPSLDIKHIKTVAEQNGLKIENLYEPGKSVTPQARNEHPLERGNAAEEPVQQSIGYNLCRCFNFFPFRRRVYQEPEFERPSLVQ